MKYLLYILILIILINFATAATVHGNVYDYELDLNKNSIVTINTVPRQTIVAKEGFYSFELDQGKYEIIAFERINNITISSVKETVTIEKQGDYTVDLILFPLIEEEELSDLDLGDIYKEKMRYTNHIIASIIAVITIISIVLYKKLKKHRQKETGIVKEEKIAKDLADKVLDFIRAEEGRTTQKDIRKKFPMSEAKISLVIAELEHKGKIQKIKKGRGNIIILK